MRTKTVQVYFSPNGTTATVIDAISREWGGETRTWDLLRDLWKEDAGIPEGSRLLAGLPVYAGRLPEVCVKMLSRLKGNGAPAVAAVVYGNRDYDDALLELADLLTARGFRVIGAGAFVAQHSIFPKVAAGRPDARDIAAITAFARECGERIGALVPGEATHIRVKGESPYRKPKSVPLKPAGNDACTRCGACVRICPTRSISMDNPRVTRKESCISCGACIHVCPAGAREFGGVVYRTAESLFVKKNAVRKEPEVFYAG